MRVAENECEWVKNELKWVGVSGSGWECVGVDGSRWKWVGSVFWLGECGWGSVWVSGGGHSF